MELLVQLKRISYSSPFAFPNVDFAMGIQKIKDLELLNYAAKFTSISELWYEY